MGGAPEAGNPHIRICGLAMFGIDAAVLQVKINEGTLYPTATVVGTVNQNWEQNLTSQLQAFNAFVQAQITVPLYPGRRGIFENTPG
jgi:hypothetical protein